MSKSLIIDAINNNISIAIIVDKKIIVDFKLENNKTHSEELMPMIDIALKFSDLKISDIDKIITTNGPGSFTGIRITLSCIKAISHINKIPIYATSSLRAANYSGRYFDGLVCPIIDARRNQVYAAVYHNGKEIVEENCYLLNDLLEKIGNQKTIFVGDGLNKYSELISKYHENFVTASRIDYTTSAIGTYQAYIDGYCKKYSYENLPANYLRIPQAQRELEARNEI